MAQKNVIQLTTTATTSGTYLEITIPDGIGGYISRKIAFAAFKDAVNLENSPNKGYFATEAALIAAFPAGENGWYAINGDTDTVWIWDEDTLAWIDTTNSGLVVSVNGMTGTVVLAAVDVAFSSLVGLSATNTRDGIDELKNYVDSVISGSGGVFVNDTRAANDVAITAGIHTITYTDPFLDTDYTLIIQDNDGVGVEIVDGSETVNGFDYEALGAGTINYIVIKNSTISQIIEAASIGYDNTDSGLTADNVQDAIDESMSKAISDSIAYAASVSVDFDGVGIHEIAEVTGNLTINGTNLQNNQSGVITFTIDSTGGYTIASGTGTWQKYDDSPYDFANCNVADTEYHIKYVILSTTIYYTIEAVSP